MLWQILLPCPYPVHTHVFAMKVALIELLNFLSEGTFDFVSCYRIGVHIFFPLLCVACGNLVHQPGVETGPLAMKA